MYCYSDEFENPEKNRDTWYIQYWIISNFLIVKLCPAYLKENIYKNNFQSSLQSSLATCMISSCAAKKRIKRSL